MHLSKLIQLRDQESNDFVSSLGLAKLRGKHPGYNA